MVHWKVSSENADPTLSPGWAYFCANTKYKGDQKDTVSFISHLSLIDSSKQFVIQRSMCVKHHAVTDANTSKSANLAASGVGTIDCVHHNMKRGHSVGDLQQGEW
jgi:hypothetical protein